MKKQPNTLSTLTRQYPVSCGINYLLPYNAPKSQTDRIYNILFEYKYNVVLFYECVGVTVPLLGSERLQHLQVLEHQVSHL